MFKRQLAREVPGVSLLLTVLFLFSLLGFFTADSVISETVVDGGEFSLVPVDARAALKIDTLKSKEVLSVATSIAIKAKEMNHKLTSEDLENAVRAAFAAEKLKVSSLVNFSAVLVELETRNHKGTDFSLAQDQQE